MISTFIFTYLTHLNLRFLPAFMFFFSLGKQSFHILYEGRISVGTFRFTLAYFALVFDKNLTIDKFILTFIGFGVIF